jgi:hypothetical protein
LDTWALEKEERKRKIKKGKKQLLHDGSNRRLANGEPHCWRTKSRTQGNQEYQKKHQTPQGKKKKVSAGRDPQPSETEMLLGWEPFEALVEELDAPKVIRWYDSLNAEQHFCFCKNLSLLERATGTKDGELVAYFDTLTAKAQHAIVTILKHATARFPASLLLSLFLRVESLREHPKLALTAQDLLQTMRQEQSQSKKRRISEEPEKGETFLLEDESPSSPSLSLSSFVLGDENEGEEEEPEEIEEGEMEESAMMMEQEEAAEDIDLKVLENLRSRLFIAGRVGGSGASQMTQVAKFAFSEEELGIVIRLENSPQIAAVLNEAPDEVLGVFFRACGSGIDAAVGSRTYTNLLQLILLPRLVELRKHASRVLLSCALECSKSNGRASVLGFLIPAILQKGESPQCEVVTRCLDEMSDVDLVLQFFRSVLDAEMVWTDNTIGVIQKVVQSSSGAFLDSDCSKLISRMSLQISTHHASVKFSKLLQTLVTKCGSVMSPGTVEMGKQLSEQLTSFLKKNIRDKFAKL